MGTYLNPGNSGFAEILASDYVDKTGLISLINATIGSKKKLTCVSRPRRFGKSYAAKMLAAYYDCSVDSHELFDELEIAEDPSYEEHINNYHVLYLDITGFFANTTLEELPHYIEEDVLEDLQEEFPNLTSERSLKKMAAEMMF